MRARLIVNPKAGANRGLALLPSIVERLRPLVPLLQIVEAGGIDDALRAAAQAAADGDALLFVAGGDGTLNAALRGVRAAGAAGAGPVIGVIPIGTGNDFAKALDLGETAESAIDALLRAHTVDVDLGLLNDHAFVNTSAGGFVADVTATLTEGLKDATGKLAFVIGGVRALFGTEPFEAEIRVGSDPGGATARLTDAPVELQMFAVCNARFIGGGYVIAPDALLDDGLLDVVIVRRMPLWEFATVLQRMATSGHPGDARVTHFRTRELAMSFNRRVRANVDGELLETTECHYTVAPRAVTFLCGERPHTATPPRPLQ